MQFHLNGFRPGDPAVSDAAEVSHAGSDEVDVLIIGCGPAGLTLAAQLARFPQIRTRIVEQKNGPMEKGQADGISCRSMEMFNAFGFAGKIMREAYWVNEVAFWKPAGGNRQHIVRNNRVQDVEDGLSEMPHVILNQARVHDMYLEAMRNAPTRLEPDYGREVTDLTIDKTQDYPVTVTLQQQDGAIETIFARYVVGCDGARSAVRKAIGGELRGDSANQAWGVMDVLAVTDFPDIRLKCLIQSQNEGNILVIPREGGHLVRLYVEMDKLAADERVASRNITADHLIAAANRILAPYSIDVKEVAWWSVYEIGHRLTDRFDDLPAEPGPTDLPNVFIAGDACHTHSPKAGQGMNVSMGDTFNLGWKLVHVLTGRADQDLLLSYSSERQTAAQGLIEFDHEWARIMSAPPEGGRDTPAFQKYFIEHGRYTAGVSLHYTPSRLTGGGTHHALAKGFQIGFRFHSAPVVRLADAKPMHLGHVIEADARWRLFAFADAGEPAAPGSGIQRLCTFLENDPKSPIRRHTRPDEDIDAVIDLRAVFQQGHRDLAIEFMPPLLMPRKGRFRLQDREKMFCADLIQGQDIFEMREIDRQRGALVIVRPDQYVAEILPLDAYTEMSTFFSGILRSG